MASVANELKEKLEARGEYVVTANTSWFAVFLSTWRHRIEQARQDGREGPNLVVCRTKSDDERDHHAIPYSVISGLLVDDTMTTSEVNGSQRWNLTLKNDRLHVSHRKGSIDVSGFHGTHLLVEDGGVSPEKVATTTRASGAGFGTAEQNRRVEETAVAVVSEAYRNEGWEVISVEHERCGFDLRCSRGTEEAHVEVKGVAGGERRFVITAGELRRAQEDHQFVLALVTRALSAPVLERLPASEFRRSFRFEPIQYWAYAPERDSSVGAVEQGQQCRRG